MVRIEIVHEIIADFLLAGLRLLPFQFGRDEIKILFQMLFAESDLEEFLETHDNIVFKVLMVSQGDDAVFIGGERLVLAGIKLSPGKYQPLLVERITMTQPMK